MYVYVLLQVDIFLAMVRVVSLSVIKRGCAGCGSPRKRSIKITSAKNKSVATQ